MNDKEVDQVMKEKGLVAKRVMVAEIAALYGTLEYRFHHFTGTTLTICVATLPNGFSSRPGKAPASVLIISTKTWVNESLKVKPKSQHTINYGSWKATG